MTDTMNGFMRRGDERMNNVERHQKILDEIHDTYIRKNNDYGDSFAQVHREIGIQADLGQICHKWNRL